ncbi:synaptotagmin-4 [Camelus ferus]|nr:synaptotagmin-4 [Camelus ferus]
MTTYCWGHSREELQSQPPPREHGSQVPGPALEGEEVMATVQVLAAWRVRAAGGGRQDTKDGELLFVHLAEGSGFWSALLEKAMPRSTGVTKRPQAGEGHAYSVTGAAEGESSRGLQKLICSRNPWGEVEWTGPWNDNCPNWNTVDPDIKLEEEDQHQEGGKSGCTFLVGLIQKHRRRQRKRNQRARERLDAFIHLREVRDRFKLPPGEDALMPSTFEPNRDGDFCILGQLTTKFYGRHVDSDGSGKLGRKEFYSLWTEIQKYQKIHREIDAGRSGSVNSCERRKALEEAGFELRCPLHRVIITRLADEIPTVVGIFSAFGLVFTVSLFAWICCQRKSSKSNKTPPYKFVHVLKGVDIYPENLNSKKKFGADEKNEVKNTPAAPKNSLHLDLEKRDLNGNFPKTNLKAGSPSDLENVTPKLSSEGEKEAVSPDSLKSSTSLASDEKQEKLGALVFSLEYNFEKKAFMVNIKEARGLPAMDEQSMTSDPYIKMTILPEKKHKVKTRVLRKTLDPAFDETFTFYGIPYTQIQELALHFTILSFDRFSRDDIIGEVLIPLAGIELTGGKMLMNREIIKRNVRKSSGRGELLISLCYQSTTNTLTVVVLKARHLPKSDVSGLSDPYVKVNLYHAKKRISKKKTHVKKCTPNAVFNELFVFDIPCEGLEEISVEFLVLDSERGSRNEVIGRLVLGAAAEGTGGEHWKEICDYPRRQIAKWHVLCDG